jgi:phage N-6-adenine-methyltransferase
MSTNYEWETPEAIYKPLEKEFDITFDVCATHANRKTQRFFDKQANGLIREWGPNEKVVWMNPPFGSEIGKWVRKAYDEAKKGVTTVALLPARTDTSWFHNYILDKHEIRFLKGRIKFKDAKSSAPFPSMIVIFKGRKEKQKLLKTIKLFFNK